MHKLSFLWRAHNIFEWHDVKKAQFTVFFSSLLGFYMYFLCMLLLSLDLPPEHSINLDYLQSLHVALIFYSVANFISFVAGFFIPENDNSLRCGLFIFTCLLLYSVGNVIAVFYLGVFSIITGVALAGGSVVGLLLFNWRYVFLVFFISVMFSVWLFLESALGYLPYGALFSHTPALHLNLSWVILVVALATPQVGSLFFIAFVSVWRWKNREKVITYMSKTDYLTSLSNRRFFMETLQQKIQQANSSNKPLALLMLDLDNFKMINDRFGHQVGDRVIQTASELMREIIIDKNCLARYGGEEFCALLDNVCERAAIETAETIRRKIKQHGEGDEHSIDFSVSIGVVIYNPREHALAVNSTSLLQTADKALYAAKAGGRNCVRLAKLKTSASNLAY